MDDPGIPLFTQRWKQGTKEPLAHPSAALSAVTELWNSRDVLQRASGLSQRECACA
jgi:hypothetical protein